LPGFPKLLSYRENAPSHCRRADRELKMDVPPDSIGQRIVSKGVRIINPCLRWEWNATRDPVAAFPASIDNALNDITSFDYEQPVSIPCRRKATTNEMV
jgi:hypothetical protein